jgi:hypothetical protein
MFLRKRTVFAVAGLVTVSQVSAGDFCRIKEGRNARQQTSCDIELHSDCNATSQPGFLSVATCCEVQNLSCCDGSSISCTAAPPEVGGVQSAAIINEQPVAPIVPIQPQNTVEPPIMNVPSNTNPEPITEEQRKAEEERRRTIDGVRLNPPQMRKWSDSTGKFHAIAKLQEVAEDSVLLLKENGKSVRVKLNRLSSIDQLYLGDLPSNAKSLLGGSLASKNK